MMVNVKVQMAGRTIEEWKQTTCALNKTGNKVASFSNKDTIRRSQKLKSR